MFPPPHYAPSPIHVVGIIPHTSIFGIWLMLMLTWPQMDRLLWMSAPIDFFCMFSSCDNHSLREVLSPTDVFHEIEFFFF